MIVDKYGAIIEVDDLVMAPRWHGIVVAIKENVLEIEEASGSVRSYTAQPDRFRAVDLEVIDA